MKLLGVAVLFLSQLTFADHFLHDQIDRCAVTSDAACLKSILHQLVSADGGTPPSGFPELIPGNYTKTGNSNFCPQTVAFRDESGPKVRVTYNTPCSGGSDDLTCNGNACSNADGSRSLYVLSRTSYLFKDGADEDTFKKDGVPGRQSK